MGKWLTRLFGKKEQKKKFGPQSPISTGSLTSAHANGRGMAGISRNSLPASTSVISSDSSGDVDDFEIGILADDVIETAFESSSSGDSWSGGGGDFSGGGASDSWDD